MALFHDQLKRIVEIEFPPERIVSLVPSQTELLFDLGLEDRIVGVTKFCIHPAAQVKGIRKVGGTKQLDREVIGELRPDLIIANKEENERTSIEYLMQRYPVWVSDIHNLEEALDMITKLGEITGRLVRASNLAAVIGKEFQSIQKLSQTLSAIYLIWRKPYMAAGSDTFIDQMLGYCGFTNAIAQARYPIINVEELQRLSPQLVLLSSEPYPFRQKHVNELKAVLPDAKIVLVDGEMFSWYGSRLKYAPSYFNELILRVQS